MAKILVVDDRPTDRQFMTDLLGYYGHVLLEASDGAEALEIVRREQPDLTITDILMPTMDGYEFVCRLREDPLLEDAKVIFYTATYMEREAAALMKKCGVSSLILKPCEPQEMIRIVEAALVPIAVPVQAYVADGFEEEHLRLVTNKLSEKAGELAIKNLRLAALIELGTEMARERDPIILLDKYNSAARELIGAKCSALGVLSDDGQTVMHFMTCGLDPQIASRLNNASACQGIISEMVKDRQPRRVRNPSSRPQDLGLPGNYPDIYSLLAAPIATPKDVYGWLCLANKLGLDEFSEEDESLLSTLASQVALAYENVLLWAQTKWEAAKMKSKAHEGSSAQASLQTTIKELNDIKFALDESSIVAITDKRGRITYVNDKFCEISKYSREELLGQDHRIINSGHHPKEFFINLWKTIASGEVWRGEVCNRAKDGSLYWVDTTIVPFLDNEGKPYQYAAIRIDITKRRHVEEALRISEDNLRQAQKMEAIGRLAGGIAHDFNNLLTAINGYSDLTMLKLREGDPLRHNIEEIKKAGVRAASLTRQLLAFSRKQVLQPVVLNLNVTVTDIDTMLRRLIGEDIKLMTVLESHLGNIKADPGQLEQIIMNLAVNARDAMPDGGKLIIETSNIHLDEQYASHHIAVRPGRYVLLAVTDTGCGMDAETQKKIFEPFFTTKEPDRGTGLGLSTVYGIVKQSGGNIWVYSEVGRGTTFKIYLPCVDENAEAIPMPRLSSISQTKGKTVLLAEDEAQVRSITSEILKLQGYEVLEATDGATALLIAEAQAGRIDLLLTDVVMPQMGGRELVRKMMALCPKMKVLYMSGYTEVGILQHGVLDEGASFIQKPFTPESLSQKLEEMLSAA